jgi:hypothetical protein
LIAEENRSGVPVQVDDGLPDLADRAGAHTRSFVEHPVDRRLADAGLPGDFPDRVRVRRHGSSLMSG